MHRAPYSAHTHTFLPRTHTDTDTHINVYYSQSIFDRSIYIT